MFKRFFSSLVLVATVALYGCGGGGGGGDGGGGGGGGTIDQLVSIAVTPVTPSVAVGASQQFTATGTYTVSSPKDLTASVTWSSSDTSKATVTASGNVTAVAVGVTTIKAISGGVPGEITLTVTAQPVAGIIAGFSGTSGTADGTGSAARFQDPEAITTDGTNLYVADTLNKSVRKVTPAGVVTTIASLSSTPFAALYGITYNGGFLYVTEALNNIVLKIEISTGQPTTIAGTAGLSGTTDGTGAAARFNEPRGIATDGTNLYVADHTDNGSIRKIVLSTGVVTTIASVTRPLGITTFGGDLYVTSDISHTIIKITIDSGVQEVVAGSSFVTGSTNGTGSAALFNSPNGIVTDGTNLYVADSGNAAIRKIVISTKVVTTVATQSSTIRPTGITEIGSTIYTTNNDHTIRSY